MTVTGEVEAMKAAALERVLAQQRQEETAAAVALQDARLFSAARVKQGLLWLGTDEARNMGLSLDKLIEQAVKNPETAERFNVIMPDRCALGYANTGGTGSSRWRFYQIVDAQGGSDWAAEHGFEIEGDGNLSVRAATPAYEVLTEEWRRQLQALAEETGA